MAWYKLRNWEYWPVWLVYLPCFFLYPIYALRCRSTLFFTAANPGIANGGAFLVPKDQLYDKLPKDLIPKTLLWRDNSSADHVREWMLAKKVSYPLVLKPNYGVRGLGLRIVSDEQELTRCMDHTDAPYLIQEYIAYENELGIFFIKDPQSNKVEISSIVNKGFMQLEGDGEHTVEQLLQANNRYALQIESLRKHSKFDFDRIPNKGELLEFDKIGNHSRGAVFSDGKMLNTQTLQKIITDILRHLDGVYYGRIDLKFKSKEELEAEKSYKVIEINGAFSEPAHIYDPSYSLWNAWKVIIKHFGYLFRISVDMINQGIRPMQFSEGVRLIVQHFRMSGGYLR